MVNTLIYVALGGAAGAVSRYGIGLWALRAMGPGFPWGTICVNVLGSFLMGCAVVVLGHLNANRFAPLVLTGFLGGFTTFSAFSLDAVTLYERGDVMAAGLYVGASVILSLAALFAGILVMRGVVA